MWNEGQQQGYEINWIISTCILNHVVPQRLQNHTWRRIKQYDFLLFVVYFTESFFFMTNESKDSVWQASTALCLKQFAGVTQLKAISKFKNHVAKPWWATILGNLTVSTMNVLPLLARHQLFFFMCFRNSKRDQEIYIKLFSKKEVTQHHHPHTMHEELWFQLVQCFHENSNKALAGIVSRFLLLVFIGSVKYLRWLQ